MTPARRDSPAGVPELCEPLPGIASERRRCFHPDVRDVAGAALENQGDVLLASLVVEVARLGLRPRRLLGALVDEEFLRPFGAP